MQIELSDEERHWISEALQFLVDETRLRNTGLPMLITNPALKTKIELENLARRVRYPKQENNNGNA